MSAMQSVRMGMYLLDRQTMARSRFGTYPTQSRLDLPRLQKGQCTTRLQMRALCDCGAVMVVWL